MIEGGLHASLTTRHKMTEGMRESILLYMLSLSNRSVKWTIKQKRGSKRPKALSGCQRTKRVYGPLHVLVSP